MSARLQQQHRINRWSTIRISYLGYAHEAVLAIKQFGFRELKLLRLEIVAAIDNKPSNRVAIKSGARFEYVDKQRIQLKSGYVDANVYGFFASKEPV